MDASVAAAGTAFEAGTWSNSRAGIRVALLHRYSDLLQVSLELGGKSPAQIFPGAPDIAVAAATVVGAVTLAIEQGRDEGRLVMGGQRLGGFRVSRRLRAGRSASTGSSSNRTRPSGGSSSRDSAERVVIPRSRPYTELKSVYLPLTDEMM